MLSFIEVTLLVLAIYCGLKLLILFFNEKNNFWLNRGVPRALPTEFASWFEIIARKKSAVDLQDSYYRKYEDAPSVGYMEMNMTMTPVLMLRDLELIQQVSRTDFDHFVDHRPMSLSTAHSIMNSFLFNLKGQEWKDMRKSLNPSLMTSEGIRDMVWPTLQKTGHELVNYINDNLNNDGRIVIAPRDFFGRYMMEIMSTTVFGYHHHHHGQCLQDPRSKFVEMGRKLKDIQINLFSWSWLCFWFKFLAILLTPNIAKLLKISICLLNAEALDFFQGIIKHSIAMTKRGGNDDKIGNFLDLLVCPGISNSNSGSNMNQFEKDAQIQIKSEGKINSRILNDNTVLANCVGFLLAGLDTTEAILLFSSYYLAVYPEHQEKIREEVEQVTLGGQGQITYESLAQMKFLEMFIREVLRLHPPYYKTERKATKSYQIPNTDIAIPVGTLICFPIRNIHLDEKYYPEPEKFKPERFTEENVAQRHPCAFLPFGYGPRGCIGMRFAITAIKSAITHSVQKFELSPSPETFIPVQVEIANGLLRPSNDLKISLKPRV